MSIARFGHGVIVQKGQFVVIGGVTDNFEQKYATELCTLKDDSIECKTFDSENSKTSPQMMRVPPEFCPK